MHLWLLFFLPHFAAAAGPINCAPTLISPALNAETAQAITQIQRKLEGLETPAGKATSCAEKISWGQEQLEILRDSVRMPLMEIRKNENEWIEAALKRSATCDQDQTLAEAQTFLEKASDRIKQIAVTATSARTLYINLGAEKEIYKNLEATKTFASCMEDARGHVSTLAAALDYCRETTGTSKDLWQAINRLQEDERTMAVAGLGCLLDDKSFDAIGESFKKLASLEPLLAKYLAGIVFYKSDFGENAPKQLIRIALARQQLKSQHCAEAQADAEAKMKRSVPRLRMGEDSYGTGFYVSTKNGKEKELVTAHHVAAVENSMLPLTIEEETSLRPFRFAIEPGDYNRSSDIVKHRIDTPQPAIPVASEESIPKAGDRFTLYGYARNREGNFTQHTCKYLGVTDATLSTSEGYLLYCPGAESHIQGMSGGPAVGEDGKTIGVVQAHYTSPNLVVVNPLSQDAAGKTHIGFQKIFFADCYSRHGSESHPCQVIPGLTYETGIP